MREEIPALEIRHIFKRFQRRAGVFRRRTIHTTEALKDINFAVRRGETVGLLGPNGSGKTTLLKSISTLIEPTSGEIFLDGINVVAEPKQARRRLGLVTCDERSFYWRLSARENLSFFGALFGMDATRTRQRSEMLLEMLGLSYAADRPFQSFSSGMKQKLAVARGLLAEPSLILYDEPTRSLDPVSASNIRKWLKENRKNHPEQTHLIATNLLNEAEELCDRVVIINRGVLLAQGTIAEIKQRWNSEAYRRWVIKWSGPTALESLQKLLGGEPPKHSGSPNGYIVEFEAYEGDDLLSKVLAALLAEGAIVRDCRSESASFDEVFCSMVESRASSGEVKE